mgnify:CR=1 FL=1
MKDKKTFPWSELLKKWFVFYTIIYLIIVAIIGIFLVWNVFESKNIYEKVLSLLEKIE